MKIVDWFRVTAFAQALLGLVAFSVVDANPTVVVVAGTLAILAWYVVESPGGRALPRWLLYLAALGATAWLIDALFSRGSDREPMIVAIGRYLTALILIKLFEGKTNRDWAQVMVLSVLQLMSALLRRPDLGFGLLAGLYCASALLAAPLFAFKLAHDEVLTSRAKQAPVGVGPVATVGAWGPGFMRQVHAVALGCGVLTMGAMLAAFVFVPRSSGKPLMENWRLQSAMRVSGFAANVQLDDEGGGIYTSTTPVMNVKVHRDGREVGPGDTRAIYLRGTVQDRYNANSGVWSRTTPSLGTGGAVLTVDAGKFSVARLLPIPTGMRGERTTLDITMRATTGRYYFSTYQPMEIELVGVDSISFDPYDMVIESQTQQPLGADNHYRVTSVDSVAGNGDPGFGAARTRMLPATWGRYARGGMIGERHKDYPAFVEAAGVILAACGAADRDRNAHSTPSDHAIAQRVMEYLSTNYIYTLDRPSNDGVEPITAFLSVNRMGHCEYFASAMCAVLRSAGMRARLVSGFVASEYNSLGRYFIVRDKHAHAWVEVWQDAVGWRTFDPSPAATVASLHSPGARGLLDPLRDLYDWTENSWTESVVRYDSSKQDSMMSSLAGMMEWLGAGWKEFRRFGQNMYHRMGVWGPVLALVLAVFIVVKTSRRVLRQVARDRVVRELKLTGMSWAQQQEMASRLAFYPALLHILREKGLTKPHWQPPGAFAAAAVAADAGRFAPVVPLTELFYEIRFGGRELDAQREGIIREQMEALRAGV